MQWIIYMFIIDFISHANSGCGLFNLDLNSGWAWVATKYFKSGNSMNSTSFQFGDNQENSNQFFDNISWNLGLTSYLCLCLSFTMLLERSIWLNSLYNSRVFVFGFRIAS